MSSPAPWRSIFAGLSRQVLDLIGEMRFMRDNDAIYREEMDRFQEGLITRLLIDTNYLIAPTEIALKWADCVYCGLPPLPGGNEAVRPYPGKVQDDEYKILLPMCTRCAADPMVLVDDWDPRLSLLFWARIASILRTELEQIEAPDR